MPVKQKRTIKKQAPPTETSISTKARVETPEVKIESTEESDDNQSRVLVYSFSEKRKIYADESDGRLYWQNGVMLNRKDRRAAAKAIRRNKRG